MYILAQSSRGAHSRNTPRCTFMHPSSCLKGEYLRGHRIFLGVEDGESIGKVPESENWLYSYTQPSVAKFVPPFPHPRMPSRTILRPESPQEGPLENLHTTHSSRNHNIPHAYSLPTPIATNADHAGLQRHSACMPSRNSRQCRPHVLPDNLHVALVQVPAPPATEVVITARAGIVPRK